MNPIVLSQDCGDSPWQVSFRPDRGMCCTSLQVDGREWLDPETAPEYERRFAGLGAFIGPHFHNRKDGKGKPIDELAAFPHTAILKAKGRSDPFPHGIGRYAPWQWEQPQPHQLIATLSSDDTWQGYRLGDLEGYRFQLRYEAELRNDGLHLHLSGEADDPMVMGLHFYYRWLPGSRIHSFVQPEYNHGGSFEPLPTSWTRGGQLEITEPEDFDYGFLPFDRHSGTLEYLTPHGTLALHFHDPRQRPISFQIFRPAESSFLCLEPLSTPNPRALERNSADLSVSFHLS